MLPTIALHSLPINVLDDTQRRLQPWVQIQGNPAPCCGVAVDAQALSPIQQWLLDQGALLPEWAYHWLTLGAELMRTDQNRELGTVLIVPSTKATSVFLLETTEIATALGMSAFRQESGVIVAWGIASATMARLSKPTWPLPCLGAVASVVDGLGMVCVAAPEELTRVNAWVKQM